MSVYEDVVLLQQQMTEAQTAITALQTAVAAMQVTDIAADTDLNTLTAAGHYRIPSAAVCGTLTNKPTTSNATGEIIITSGGNVGQAIMKYIPCNKDDPSYYQRCYYENAWGDWDLISLIDSGWINLTLENGATAYSDGQKPRYRKIGNEVFLSGVYKGVSGTNVTIATLPNGYRPTNKVIAACASVGQMFSKISIETDGRIILNRSSIEPIGVENWHSIACSFSL